ncbi:NDR1/HIN1-like protein 1 [Olea europaea var. sylvestris]|uniref:NDR1 HIN1 1 n=1 Tax=Olea europaea subsp. europaea TaxID=158383 RepID=A0A8S0VGQ6_OLEEU|nr:NDR1/HIN1-like protein 1 [Olea europaea var. sylvestris]CAA3031877.1 NDR1 HIN1 1 [Olea europaea subsp. europaea]
MSEKCSHHKSKRRKLLWRWFSAILIFIFIILVIILLVFAILEPKSPRFVLQDATVFNLTVSTATPNIISTSIQVTIYSRNPNDKIGIYYDKMDVYATYHHQQITYFTSIPPVYQGHKDVNLWSPFVYGDNVPVAPFNGLALSQDQSNGVIPVVFKIDSRVKWKVGSFVTGRYHLHVSCPAYISLGNNQNTGIWIGNAVKYQISQSCSVSI